MHYTLLFVGLAPDWFAQIDIFLLGKATCCGTHGTTDKCAADWATTQNGAAYGARTSTNCTTAKCAVTGSIPTRGEECEGGDDSDCIFYMVHNVSFGLIS
jgi:hypothetical protein